MRLGSGIFSLRTPFLHVTYVFILKNIQTNMQETNNIESRIINCRIFYEEPTGCEPVKKTRVERNRDNIRQAGRRINNWPIMKWQRRYVLSNTGSFPGDGIPYLVHQTGRAWAVDPRRVIERWLFYKTCVLEQATLVSRSAFLVFIFFDLIFFGILWLCDNDRSW